jgi:two-component system chemotaxis response regulator CheY
LSATGFRPGVLFSFLLTIKMTEKRKITRHKSFLRGVAYFNQDAASTECLVRDISEAGARLELPNSFPRGGDVDIAIPINGKHYKGTVQWQHEQEVGVAFTTIDAALVKSKNVANAKTERVVSSRTGMNTSAAVLIVDDSRTMCLVISELVQKLGFAYVDVAHDGHEALDKLRKGKYGLILSDWEMQPMGGEEFLKETRQDKRIGNIPIVLISAKASRGASRLSGASAYLTKPFKETDLKLAIERAFLLNS